MDSAATKQFFSELAQSANGLANGAAYTLNGAAEAVNVAADAVSGAAEAVGGVIGEGSDILKQAHEKTQKLENDIDRKTEAFNKLVEFSNKLENQVKDLNASIEVRNNVASKAVKNMKFYEIKNNELFELFNSLIVCEKCNKEFSVDRNPLVLSCGHYLCSKCFFPRRSPRIKKNAILSAGKAIASAMGLGLSKTDSTSFYTSGTSDSEHDNINSSSIPQSFSGVTNEKELCDDSGNCFSCTTYVKNCPLCSLKCHAMPFNILKQKQDVYNTFKNIITELDKLKERKKKKIIVYLIIFLILLNFKRQEEV